MKTTINKFTITLMMLLINISIFAQPNPDPVPGPGGDADPEDLLAPIDANVYYLLAIGILFVAYKYYQSKQISKS